MPIYECTCIVAVTNDEGQRSAKVAAASVYPVEFAALGYKVLAVGPEVILRLNEGIDRVAEIFECVARPHAAVCPNVHYMSWRKAQSLEQREKMFKAVRTDDSE